MNSSVSAHRTAALAACAATAPLLNESGLAEISAQLVEIESLARAGDEEAAFALARKLPQYDVADFWDPLAWVQKDQLPLERKALVTSYYTATRKALVNWRVAKTYGSEREVVDVQTQALEAAATALLAQQKRGLHAPDA